MKAEPKKAPASVTVAASKDPYENSLDLIALADSARDSGTGAWRIEWNELFAPLSQMSNKMKFEFPYEPPAEYDYLAELSVQPGGGNESDTTLVLSRGEVSFGFKFFCF